MDYKRLITKSISRTQISTWIIILIGLTGSIAIIYSTPWGAWAFSDSTEYIVSARSFLAGGRLGYYDHPGQFIPLFLHPPLYPLLLSFFGWLGFDLFSTARWLNVLLFGGIICGSGLFTQYLLRSNWLAIITSVTILTLPELVDISSGAMTEPLFLFAGIMSIGFLMIFFNTSQRRWLVWSAISASLAFLSRYPGIVVIAAGMIGISIFNRAPLKERMRNLATYSSISLVPTGIWLLWIYQQTQTFSARNIITGINPWQALVPFRLSLAEIFWSWLPFLGTLLPYSYELVRNILCLMLGILGFLFIITLIQRKKAGQLKWPISQEFIYVMVWVLATGAYLVLLAFSYIFTIPVPDIIWRTMLPVQLFLVFILFGSSLFFIKELNVPRWVRFLPILLGILFIIPNTQTSLELIQSYHNQGAGYTSISWHNSNTIEAINRLAPDIPIITNQADAILLLTNRSAYDFCELPCNLLAGTLYGDNPSDETQRIFRENNAALVLIYPFCTPTTDQWFMQVRNQITALTRGLTEWEYSCDGAIYFYPQGTQSTP
jgi:hypothetical protein